MTKPWRCATAAGVGAGHPRGGDGGAGLTVPFWNTWAEDMFVPGIDSVSRLGNFTLQAGTGDYFATMGTRILRGRGIDRGPEGAPRASW